MAERTGSGFTDFISSDTGDRSRVLEDGGPTKADRSFIGEGIARLGKTVGDVFELGSDTFKDQIVGDLQDARNEAFEEAMAYQKRGEAAMAQGRTTSTIYQTALRKKMVELETKYPGFAEEFESAKVAMGIKPTQSLIAEQAQMEAQDRQRIISSAQEMGTLQYEEDGSVDYEATVAGTVDVQNTINQMAAIQRKGQASLVTDGPVIFDAINKSFQPIQALVTEGIRSANGNEEVLSEYIGSLPGEIDRWQLMKTSEIEGQANYPQALKTAAIEHISNKAELYRQIVTGDKDPQGKLKTMENIDKGLSVLNRLEAREVMPVLMRLSDLTGEEFGRIIANSLISGMIADSTIVNQKEVMLSFLQGQEANSAAPSVNNTPSLGSAQQDAQAGLGFVSEYMKSGINNEQQKMGFATGLGYLQNAFETGEINTNDIPKFTKMFSDPRFKTNVESIDDPEFKREVGEMAATVLGRDMTRRVMIIQEKPTHLGITYRDGKFVISDSLLNRAGRGQAAAMNKSRKEEAQLNKYFDSLVYFTRLENPDMSSKEVRNKLVAQYSSGKYVEPGKTSSTSLVPSSREQVAKDFQESMGNVESFPDNITNTFNNILKWSE